jgi:hypothetical protein
MNFASDRPDADPEKANRKLSSATAGACGYGPGTAMTGLTGFRRGRAS